MSAERPDHVLQQRQQVAESLKLQPGFIPNAVSSLQLMEQQQVDAVETNGPAILAWLEKVQHDLQERGYQGTPSTTRLRAEFVASLGRTWYGDAEKAYKSDDLHTYVLFHDIAMGAVSVAGAIIEGNNINTQHSSGSPSAEISQAIAHASGKDDTASSADLHLHGVSLAKRYAQALQDDPTGFKTVDLALMQLATPPEQDPFAIPGVIPEFVLAGGRMAQSVLKKVRELQETL